MYEEQLENCARELCRRYKYALAKVPVRAEYYYELRVGSGLDVLFSDRNYMAIEAGLEKAFRAFELEIKPSINTSDLITVFYSARNLENKAAIEIRCIFTHSPPIAPKKDTTINLIKSDINKIYSTIIDNQKLMAQPMWISPPPPELPKPENFIKTLIKAIS